MNTKKDNKQITKLFKDFTKMSKSILKQIEKEQKLKTIKAKLNAIEKALQHLVDLKNVEMELLSILDKSVESSQIKNTIQKDIKDLEDRLSMRYDELDIASRPKAVSTEQTQIKKDIKKIYKQGKQPKPTRAELEDPLSVLSPRSRTKAEKILSKIVITPEMVLPFTPEQVKDFKKKQAPKPETPKPKTPKPKTPKPKTPKQETPRKSFEERQKEYYLKEKNKTYEQRLKEREQKIKNNEEQVKRMTTPEILEELRKYGWTKKAVYRQSRADLEDKLLYSMMPNAIFDISGDDDD